MPAFRFFIFAVTFPDVYECLHFTFSYLRSHPRMSLSACKSRYSNCGHFPGCLCVPAIHVILIAVTSRVCHECLQFTLFYMRSHPRMSMSACKSRFPACSHIPGGIMYDCKSRFSDMSHRYRMVCVTTIHVSRMIRKRCLKSGGWLTQAA